MNLNLLHVLVSRVAPIVGINIGEIANKATWIVTYNGATAPQIAAAEAVIAAFDEDSVAGVQGADINFECRLEYVNATTVQLMPIGQGRIYIDGVTHNIRDYTPQLASSSLGASTLRYVYAYHNGVALLLEPETTVPLPDPTYGHMIKGTDPSFVLVGQVRTDAAGNFADTERQRFVASYYNRRLRVAKFNLGTARTWATTGYSEISASDRIEFIVWGEETVPAWQRCLLENTLGNNTEVGVGVDALTQILAKTFVRGGGAGVLYQLSGSDAFLPTIGYHYLSLAGSSFSTTTATLNVTSSGLGAMLRI